MTGAFNYTISLPKFISLYTWIIGIIKIYSLEGVKNKVLATI